MQQYVELALVGGDQPCVADAVAESPLLPHEPRRLPPDHDDGIEATWDAVDAVDATTSSSKSFFASRVHGTSIPRMRRTKGAVHSYVSAADRHSQCAYRAAIGARF